MRWDFVVVLCIGGLLVVQTKVTYGNLTLLGDCIVDWHFIMNIFVETHIFFFNNNKIRYAQRVLEWCAFLFFFYNFPEQT